MQQTNLKKIMVIVTVVPVTLLVGGCLGKPQDAGKGNETPAIPVVILTATNGEITDTLPVTGQLQSDNRVTLTSKVAGKIIRMMANTGDHVSPGQLVAQLDDTDATSQLQEAQAALVAARVRYEQSLTGVNLKDVQTKSAIETAQAGLIAAQSHLKQTRTSASVQDTQAQTDVQTAMANLKSAQQNLSLVQEGARKQEKAQANIAVEKAQADFNHAQDNFNRMESLYKQGGVSQQDRDDANYAMQTALTALHAASQNASLVEAGSRSQQVAIAEEQARLSEAAYENSRAQLLRVSMSHDDVAQAVQQVHQAEASLAAAKAGTAQYAMTRQDVAAAGAAVGQAVAAVSYAQEQLDSTQIYSPVDGVVDSRPATIGSSVTATTVLMTIIPSQGVYFEASVPERAIASIHIGDPVNTTVDAIPGRTFPGRVSEIIPIADPSTKLYRIHISIPDSNGILPQNGFARGHIVVARVQGIVVSRDALSSMVGDSYLYVVKDGKAQRRFVTLGITNDIHAQVLTGLIPGEQYIGAGKNNVSEGARVISKPDYRNAT